MRKLTCACVPMSSASFLILPSFASLLCGVWVASKGSKKQHIGVDFEELKPDTQRIITNRQTTIINKQRHILHAVWRNARPVVAKHDIKYDSCAPRAVRPPQHHPNHGVRIGEDGVRRQE